MRGGNVKEKDRLKLTVRRAQWLLYIYSFHFFEYRRAFLEEERNCEEVV